MSEQDQWVEVSDQGMVQSLLDDLVSSFHAHIEARGGISGVDAMVIAINFMANTMGDTLVTVTNGLREQKGAGDDTEREVLKAAAGIVYGALKTSVEAMNITAAECRILLDWQKGIVVQLGAPPADLFPGIMTMSEN